MTSPLNNVVIKEGGGAEAEEEDGGRDDNDFEGDGNNLGRRRNGPGWRRGCQRRVDGGRG